MTRPTIAAIATPAGTGGIGIIRISGPDARAIASVVAPGFSDDSPSHRLVMHRLISPSDGSLLDQALVVWMRAPHSYTGDHVVELHCHGGPVNLRRVLDAVLTAGARPAEPGEFTRRAFLNGRLDLVQAEAVADLIWAKSEAACRLATRHLEGRLSREIDRLAEELADTLALLEAGIDFSLEEHVYAVDRPALAEQLRAAIADVDRLLESYDRGRRLREGVRCVIAGRPNVGKSTLLNRLLEEDRAIVSPTAGTTRDYVDAELVVDGQLFVLVDTAGLRDSAEPIEAEGVRRARRLVESADLILYVGDRTLPSAAEDAELIAGLSRPGVLFWNKVDQPARCTPPLPPEGWIGPVDVQLTADSSLEVVRMALREAAGRIGAIASAESPTLSRARHRDAFNRAREHLRVAERGLRDALDHELVALDLRLALDAVGEVMGRIAPEEILHRVFAEFCVGK